MVEFAIIAPLMLLLLLIAVDFGRLFFTYIAVNNAAREGAAFGSLAPADCGGNPCLATSGIATHASQETNTQTRGGGATTIAVSATCAQPDGTGIACSTAITGGAGAGNTITVSAKQSFRFFTPIINGFFGNNFNLGASATAVVLGYAASGTSTPPPTCALPVPSFTVVVTSGRTIFADPTASRPNSGTCNISGFNWSWGDLPLGDSDSVGTATGDSYTYAADGTYTITLEVTNQGGSATTTRNVTVPFVATAPPCAVPTANFSGAHSGNGGKTVTYTDHSSVADSVNCPITDWLWTFSDQGNPPLQSNAQNPAPVTYGNSSSHPVTLKVTNAGGSASVTLSP